MRCTPASRAACQAFFRESLTSFSSAPRGRLARGRHAAGMLQGSRCFQSRAGRGEHGVRRGQGWWKAPKEEDDLDPGRESDPVLNVPHQPSRKLPPVTSGYEDMNQSFLEECGRVHPEVAIDRLERPRGRTSGDLLDILWRLDGCEYERYVDLSKQRFVHPIPVGKGLDRPHRKRNPLEEETATLQLRFSYVSSTPTAPPGTVEVMASPAQLGWASDVWQHEVVTKYNALGFSPSNIAREAFADYMHRKLYAVLKADGLLRQNASSEGHEPGSPIVTSAEYGGFVDIPAPLQQILARSAVTVEDTEVGSVLVLRLCLSLPSRGSVIMGKTAGKLVRDLFASLAQATTPQSHHEVEKAKAHVFSTVRQAYLRHSMIARGYAAFIADGSLLPRRAAADQRPLPEERGITFTVPEKTATSIPLPGEEALKGLAFLQGSINVIIGPTFHGKSTLLKALSTGAYNHIQGDGREKVVASPHTAVVRSEDGRALHALDISSFFSFFPGKNPQRVSVNAALGPTSCAGSLVESLEAWGLTAGQRARGGVAPLLLIDEDQCNATWLSRDASMTLLWPEETTTPLVGHVRSIAAQTGAAVVIAASSFSAFIPEADRVIRLLKYQPQDVTDKAKSLSLPERYKPERQFTLPRERTFSTPTAWGGPKLVPVGTISLVHGSTVIDLTHVEGIIDHGQVKAVATLLTKVGHPSGETTMAKVYDGVDAVSSHRIDAADHRRPLVSALAGRRGDPFLVMPSPMHLVASINRLRKARFS